MNELNVTLQESEEVNLYPLPNVESAVKYVDELTVDHAEEVVALYCT